MPIDPQDGGLDGWIAPAPAPERPLDSDGVTPGTPASGFAR